MKGEVKLYKKEYYDAFNLFNMVKGEKLSINIFVQKCECYKNLQKEQKAIDKIQKKLQSSSLSNKDRLKLVLELGILSK